jgi:hypothetical protein
LRLFGGFASYPQARAGKPENRRSPETRCLHFRSNQTGPRPRLSSLVKSLTKFAYGRCRRCHSADHNPAVAEPPVARSAKVRPRGRPSKFCSRSCRQRAYEERKWSRPHPVELLARDIATARVKDVIRQIVREVLVEAGIISPLPPPPPPKPKRRGHSLRLVT